MDRLSKIRLKQIPKTHKAVLVLQYKDVFWLMASGESENCCTIQNVRRNIVRVVGELKVYDVSELKKMLD